MNKTKSEKNTQERVAPRVLDVNDVARIYRIPRTLQWHLRKSGALNYRQRPGSARVFYLPEDVEAYLESISSERKVAA